MNCSFFFAVKRRKTRCSICGNSVALEASKTDEQGSAVHEECYVGRTIALLAVQPQALKVSASRILQIESVSPEMMWPRW